MELDFTVNGKQETAEADPKQTLLELLREGLGLTGTKYGCGEGQCGACTVLIDGRPARSCLTNASGIGKRKVETIEGLATGAGLHPVQKAFLDESAAQCGYCIPGMIMTAVALLRANPHPTDQEILDAMNGNLCRCCGYRGILSAVHRASKGIKAGTESK